MNLFKRCDHKWKIIAKTAGNQRMKNNWTTWHAEFVDVLMVCESCGKDKINRLWGKDVHI